MQNISISTEVESFALSRQQEDACPLSQKHDCSHTISDQAIDFKQLNNLALIDRLKQLVQKERNVTIQILHFLSEVERRRLYNQKYPSLFEFCVRELGYTAGAAHRRIDSMRAINLLPQIESRIESGALALSVICKTQSFFRQEKKHGKTYTLEQKQQLFHYMENKSLRDCEKALAQISPQSAQPELVRQIDANLTEIRLTVDANFIEKLRRLRSLLSHKHPHLTHAELFEVLADIALDKLDLSRRQFRTDRKTINSNARSAITFDLSSETISPLQNTGRSPNTSRYIPASLRHHVWMRDGGRCSHPECHSDHRLQIDHVTPLAFGGTTEASNLRLLCQTHNLAYARKAFGEFHKGQWIPESSDE